MSDDYYYSGQYAEEQAEAEAQAKEGVHRPGPWHVSEHTEGRDALVYDADGFEVARVCYPNRNADAKLIAAAPMMLEALQMAFDRDLTYLSDHAEIPRQDVVRARLAIRAALGHDG